MQSIAISMYGTLFELTELLWHIIDAKIVQARTLQVYQVDKVAGASVLESTSKSSKVPKPNFRVAAAAKSNPI